MITHHSHTKRNSAIVDTRRIFCSMHYCVAAGPRKHARRHRCYCAKFGRSTSRSVGINRGELPKMGSAGAPPFAMGFWTFAKQLLRSRPIATAIQTLAILRWNRSCYSIPRFRLSTASVTFYKKKFTVRRATLCVNAVIVSARICLLTPIFAAYLRIFNGLTVSAASIYSYHLAEFSFILLFILASKKTRVRG